MRALTEAGRAIEDEVERVYVPTARIYINTIGKRNPEVLLWYLGSIIEQNPWRDVILAEDPEWYRTCTSRYYEHHYGNCIFRWQEDGEGYFESTRETFKLRKAQLLPFENWVKALAYKLQNKVLPNVTICVTGANVTFSRMMGDYHP